MDILIDVLIVLACLTGIAILGAIWLLAIIGALGVISDFRNTDNEEE